PRSCSFTRNHSPTLQITLDDQNLVPTFHKSFTRIGAQERAELLTLAAAQFTSIVDFMVIMPLGPQLMRTLAISPAQFGLIVSSYTLSAGVAGVVASSLVDRLGRKVAFLGLYVGFLIGTLLCGLAPSYGLLLAARVVTGTFGGI